MKSPWKIERFLEDLFLGSQWSIILGYRRLSVKSHAMAFQMTLRFLFPRLSAYEIQDPRR